MLHSRDKRIQESIRQILSQLFLEGLKDPRRPALLQVTRVDVTKDMREAKVYFSQLPDDDEAVEKTQDMLDSSAGFLRSRLASQLNLRHTPSLRFLYDGSSREFDRINKVLHHLKETGQLGEDKPEVVEEEKPE